METPKRSTTVQERENKIKPHELNRARNDKTAVLMVITIIIIIVMSNNNSSNSSKSNHSINPLTLPATAGKQRRKYETVNLKSKLKIHSVKNWCRQLQPARACICGNATLVSVKSKLYMRSQVHTVLLFTCQCTHHQNIRYSHIHTYTYTQAYALSHTQPKVGEITTMKHIAFKVRNDRIH